MGVVPLSPAGGWPGDKNIVMCLSAGRSGTALLAKLMSIAVDTHACHEPAPTFQVVTESVRSSAEETLNFVRDVKLPAIHATSPGNYVETSHLFGKGPFDAFMELDVRFRLLILDRNTRDVARSMWRVKAVPGRSAKRAAFVLHPELPGVIGLDGWRGLSDYQLCFWYCLEIERRKIAYEKRCVEAGLSLSRVSVDALRDFGAFAAVCASLGLSLPPDAIRLHAETVSVMHNTKPGARRLPWQRLRELDRQEAVVWDRLVGDVGELRGAVLARYPGANENCQDISTRGRSDASAVRRSPYSTHDGYDLRTVGEPREWRSWFRR